MANQSSDRYRGDPGQYRGSHQEDPAWRRERRGSSEESGNRPDEWGREWGEDWRGESSQGPRGGHWFEHERPPDVRDPPGGAHRYGASDYARSGYPYSSGYGGYDPSGGEEPQGLQQGGRALRWREQEARDRSRRGGEPSYGGGYFGSSERGGQSYSGAQRLYPGDPGYRSRFSEGYNQGERQPSRMRDRGYDPGAGTSGAARPEAAPSRRKGPKGYTRSDERIRDDVCERLANTDGIDVSEVTVEVSGGIVTLVGTVHDRREKYNIEEIADNVFGVKEVHNSIRVQRRGNADAAGSDVGGEETE
ncbi:BON domain-containing protein [Cupriavidus sp. D39]|uniref:BON domain-containing protein n=1 Tax=Cupriavidus sp. D39 TaxID=2997877 RepID=UPI00226F1FE6|nr:BON domain-containing protein [Cupriavidus sp. D39]MCY0853291.1 BON domain-containing protein [Cupriavidus sp. D39]